MVVLELCYPGCVSTHWWLLNRLKKEEAMFSWLLMVLGACLRVEPHGEPWTQWGVTFPGKG